MLHTHYLGSVSQLGMGVMRMPQTEPGFAGPLHFVSICCADCQQALDIPFYMEEMPELLKG